MTVMMWTVYGGTTSPIRVLPDIIGECHTFLDMAKLNKGTKNIEKSLQIKRQILFILCFTEVTAELTCGHPIYITTSPI